LIPTVTPLVILNTETLASSWTPSATYTPSVPPVRPTLPPVENYTLLFAGDGRSQPNRTLYQIKGDGSGEKAFVPAGNLPNTDPSVSKTGAVAYIGIAADGQS